MLKIADVSPSRREDLNETEPITGDVIVPGRVLLGVCYKERAADVLNVEGSEAVRDSLGFESIITEKDTLEIRDVKKFVAVDFARGRAFVDGAIRGPVTRVVDDEDGILPAIPAGDRSIFRNKDEVGGFARGNEKIRRAAIKNDTCWSRLGSRRRAIRRRNGDVASTINRNCCARAVVESGRAGIIVGNPPRAAARGASQSPGVFQTGIRRIWRRNRGQIRNEVRLFVMLRKCENGKQ